MDVKSAFLNDYLNEEVFVKQPPGFDIEEFPDYVFKGKVDNTLFLRSKGKNVLIVQVYLDDIIFGATNEAMCKEFAEMMGNELEMTMMGELNFFLGLQIKKSTLGTTHFLGSCLMSWATLRKYVKSEKVVRDIVAKVDIMVKEVVVQGELVQIITSQVKLSPSKLNVLVFAIDVAPLDFVPPTSGKPRVEEPTVEKNVAYMEKGWTEDEDDNRGENKEGVVGRHEGHPTQDIANEEKKSENEGDSGEEKESETKDRIDEQVDDSAEEEKNNEKEGESESEGDDQEKASESEGEDEESEDKNKNMSGESESSMTIGNTIIAPLEEASEEKRTEEPGPLLTPFTGDEEVSSNEDNLPLSKIGKKPRKNLVKETKSVVPERKEVAPPVGTPFTRSKIKVVYEQIIKESEVPRSQESKFQLWNL
ncbi:uncharacterized protein [Nicotiana sylvestris]|uniref:uncharacterized protein n=1 Tax=Nicotiana sylvestris TaxID=4096 RepID=UPI00388CAA08